MKRKINFSSPELVRACGYPLEDLQAYLNAGHEIFVTWPELNKGSVLTCSSHIAANMSNDSIGMKFQAAMNHGKGSFRPVQNFNIFLVPIGATIKRGK